MLILNLVYFRIDILLLSFFKTSFDVGVYLLAFRFFDFFIAIPLFLSSALYPKLLESVKEKKGLKLIFKNYFFIYLVFSILIIFPVWFLSPLFSFISPEFAQASVPFRVLILSLPIFFVTSFFQWILITLDKQKFLLTVYFGSVIVNIILNIIFIPEYSYLASAVITVICEAIVFVILAYKLINSKILSEQ